MRDDEEHLVTRLQRRDERAFVECMQRYQDKVWSLVYRMLGNRHEAEDVAQEVFVTVFKSIDSFRGESKFSTWLYRIAANQCKNRLKYLGRRGRRGGEAFDEATERELQRARDQGMVPSLAGPDQVLEGVQLERIMQQGIASLDEEHRVLIILRDVEELSYEEIGQITGLPEGTVKSRLHRARLALKEFLAKHMK